MITGKNWMEWGPSFQTSPTYLRNHWAPGAADPCRNLGDHSTSLGPLSDPLGGITQNQVNQMIKRMENHRKSPDQLISDMEPFISKSMDLSMEIYHDFKCPLVSTSSITPIVQICK